MPRNMHQNPTKARLRTQKPGRMNGTEKAYAAHLDTLKVAGAVVGWWFEAIKLRLADKTWYTPDFAVLMADGTLELHEVKGFWRDDARAKIKVAAEQHWPFRFVAVQWRKKQWVYETFK